MEVLTRWEGYDVVLAYDPFCIQDVNYYDAITALLVRLYLNKNKLKDHDFKFQYCHMYAPSEHGSKLYLPCILVMPGKDENWDIIKNCMWKYKMKTLTKKNNKNKDMILFSPFCEWDLADFWESEVYYE